MAKRVKSGIGFSSRKPSLKYTTITITIYRNGEKAKQSVRFVKDGCKYFYNSQHLLVQLSKAERSFYGYICERMDVSNGLMVDEEFRTAYSAFINKVTGGSVTFSSSYLMKLTRLLISQGLILETKEKSSFYIVNPKYAFAGTEVRRKRLLMDLIYKRLKFGLRIDKLLPTPIEDFLNEG